MLVCLLTVSMCCVCRCSDRKKLCGNNDCQHGATCEEISDIRYVCNCPKGYTGEKCEENIGRNTCVETGFLHG